MFVKMTSRSVLHPPSSSLYVHCSAQRFLCRIPSHPLCLSHQLFINFSTVTRVLRLSDKSIAMPLPCGITQTSSDYQLLFVFLEVMFVASSSKEEQSNALYLNALNN